MVHDQATGIMFGYARVSTDDQKMDLQIDALKKHGVKEDDIYQENISGRTTNRPQLNECLKHLRKGDILVVWRLDRLGRSLRELTNLAHELEEKGVELRSLTERIDTTSAGGRLIFNVFAAVAQFEADIISERTKAGLKAARLRGHRGGRKLKATDEKLNKARKMLESGVLTMPEVGESLGLSPSAIYRGFKRQDREREEAEAEAARKAKEKGLGNGRRTLADDWTPED